MLHAKFDMLHANYGKRVSRRALLVATLSRTFRCFFVTCSFIMWREQQDQNPIKSPQVTDVIRIHPVSKIFRFGPRRGIDRMIQRRCQLGCRATRAEPDIVVNEADELTLKRWKENVTRWSVHREKRKKQFRHVIFLENPVSCFSDVASENGGARRQLKVGWHPKVLKFLFVCVCVCVQGCDRGTMSGRCTAPPSTPTQSSSWRKFWPPKINTRRYTRLFTHQPLLPLPSSILLFPAVPISFPFLFFWLNFPALCRHRSAHPCFFHCISETLVSRWTPMYNVCVCACSIRHVQYVHMLLTYTHTHAHTHTHTHTHATHTHTHTHTDMFTHSLCWTLSCWDSCTMIPPTELVAMETDGEVVTLFLFFSILF